MAARLLRRPSAATPRRRVRHMSRTSGSMAQSDPLRHILRAVPTSVMLLTARSKDEMRGMTVGSFCGVTLEPPVLSFCVRNPSRMAQLLTRVDQYSLHALSEHQKDYSEAFSQPQSDSNPFEHINWRLDDRGRVELPGCLATIHCKHFVNHQVGTHTVWYGEVVDTVEHDTTKRPLLYYQRGYCTVQNRTDAGEEE